MLVRKMNLNLENNSCDSSADLHYTLVMLSPRSLPLHSEARKCGEATDTIRYNKGMYGDKESREQSAWVDGLLKGGKHQIW